MDAGFEETYLKAKERPPETSNKIRDRRLKERVFLSYREKQSPRFITGATQKFELLTQVEFFNHRLVAVGRGALEVIQQAAPAGDHLQEATP